MNFYSDSSNLTVAFSQVFEQARGKLPELRGRGCSIGRNNERSRSKALDPRCDGEWAGDRLKDCALQSRQMVRAARQGAKFTGLEQKIADLVGGHERAAGGRR